MSKPASWYVPVRSRGKIRSADTFPHGVDQLWFFNPSIRIAFNSSDPVVQSHLHGGAAKGMNAVKVFYARVTGNDDPRWQVSSFAHASEHRP